MKIFKLDNMYKIECVWQNEQNSFSHKATLLKDGEEIANVEVKYFNRAWEVFEFETAMKKLIVDNFENKEKETFLNAIKWENLNKR